MPLGCWDLGCRLAEDRGSGTGISPGQDYRARRSRAVGPFVLFRGRTPRRDKGCHCNQTYNMPLDGISI